MRTVTRSQIISLSNQQFTKGQCLLIILKSRRYLLHFWSDSLSTISFSNINAIFLYLPVKSGRGFTITVWTRDSVWCLQEARYYFPPSIQTLSKEQAATYSTSTLCFPPGVNRLEHEATINLHPGPKLRLTDDITHALPMTSVSTRGKLTFFILLLLQTQNYWPEAIWFDWTLWVILNKK